MSTGRRVLIGVAILLLVLLAGGGGYVYGTSVGEQRARQTRFEAGTQGGRGPFGSADGQFPRTTFQDGQPSQGQPLGGPGMVMGTVDAIEGEALVVTTQEGTVRVETTDTTLIEKYSAVDVSQLATGDQVIVSGPREDDTVTARSIRVLQRGQLQPSE